MSEQDLVNAIIDYIHLSGGLATRINSGMILVDGGQRGKTRAFRGAPAGTADILACLGGRYLAIECKQAGNKATELQLDFLDRVNRAGGIAIVAYDLDDVIPVVDDLNGRTKAGSTHRI